VSNFVGPQLTDILSSLASIGALVALFRVWKPRDSFQLAGHGPTPKHDRHHTAGELLLAWTPYLLLVLLVLLWSWPVMQAKLNTVSVKFPWPGLHNQIARMPPVTKAVAPYAAEFTFNWLSATGTVCLIATILSALVLRMKLSSFARVFANTSKQLAIPELTIASVMALAYLMNYSGATSTLGLAFAATGATFPFFSSLLGWLGVFLTGSDTSANALFGNLQVVTAGKLGLNPILMAASNSSGGVMGKMISLSSIAVAAAATGMTAADSAKLFRSNMKHSVILASVLGLVTVFYAYVMPAWAPQ
jgi:lactate permease